MALDWAFVGFGALGEDIGQLVAMSLLLPGADAGRAAELGETVLDGYLVGLREAGWQGNPHVVRLGDALGAALRRGVLAPRLDLDLTGSPEGRLFDGDDVAADVERRTLVTYYLLDLADEARALIASLGMA